MPIRLQSVADFWIRVKGDPATGTGDGASSANAAAFEHWNREIGQLSDPEAAATSGDRSAISLLKGVLGQLLGIITRPQAATTTATTATTAQTAFSIFSASTAHKKRRIANDTNGTVYLLFGSGTPSSGNFSEFLYPGSSLEFGPGDYFGEIRAIGTGNAGAIAATFWQ